MITTNEICKYLTDMEAQYHQACADRQEALEIFQDILIDDKAVRAVLDDRINEWINKIPHMSSSKSIRGVFKTDDK